MFMKLNHTARLESPTSSLAVIAPYFEGDLDSIRLVLGDVDHLAEAEARKELSGGLYKVSVFRGTPNLFLTGLGKPKDLDSVRYLRAVASGARAASRSGFEDFAIIVGSSIDDSLAVRAAVAGVILGTYDEALLKTGERRTYRVNAITVVGGHASQQILNHAAVVAESANYARLLLDLPPADLTPTIFANKLTVMANEVGLACTVLGESEIAKLGMGAILGVAKGSAEPPRVIDLRYGDDDAKVKLALVGKGLTFDAGGLSIKTGEGMEWMKADMGGAAAVSGAMRAIGTLKPEGISVRGIIGSTENMLGPSAMKPGDVLRTMNGKTIEVLNTDAEGRLVLADVLSYAVSTGATHIVDMATLTGAMAVALGHEAAGIMGRPDEWIDTVVRASDRGIERMWAMPVYPEHRKAMDSSIADMKNTGGRPGGALKAAAMLAEFVGDVPWAHVDIAGTAWDQNKTAYSGPGGTGYGVSSLVELALSLGT
jgi:leucyl aminopeptidase